jgi:hypothetical protein
MAKASDLKNKLGLGGAGGVGGVGGTSSGTNPFAAKPAEGKKEHDKGESVAGKKPVSAHDPGKAAGKSKGGAGGAGGRPKV